MPAYTFQGFRFQGFNTACPKTLRNPECPQLVIALAEKYMRSADPRFPVGRTRLETVGVVACAVIMTIATIEVIQSAGGDLVEGFLHGPPPLPAQMSKSSAHQHLICSPGLACTCDW